MADGFGKISFDLACRLGELTANESRVLIYLYVCRNEDTLQCNPSRKTISQDAKIEKGNLSKAIAGLEEKGWILEDENGFFTLFEVSKIPAKVVEVTTKKVVKATTKVVEVTTKSCRTNNSHNKEIEQRKNRERKENKTFVSDKPKPPRKESELTDSQKQAFNDGMSFLKAKIGKFPDGGAQGKALKWMLQNGADIVQIRNGLERQLTEYQGRYRASFTTLQKDIFRWIQEGNGEILENGSNQKPNYQSAADQRLQNELESERLIRDLLIEAEQESLSGEYHRVIKAYSPPS